MARVETGYMERWGSRQQPDADHAHAKELAQIANHVTTCDYPETSLAVRDRFRGGVRKTREL